MSVVASQRPIVDKNARRVLTPCDCKLTTDKAQGKAEAGSGWVEGYAFVWDNIDKQRELMVRGAFARSIQQVVPAGKVKLMAKHFSEGADVMENIGTVTEAREDDYGLWVHAEFSSVQDAQDIRTKVTEGHIKYLSGGFRPIQWEFREPVDENGNPKPAILAHLECALLETTVTNRPVNELAVIVAAKSETSPSAGLQSTDMSAPAGTAQAPASTPPPSPVLPRVQREIAIARASLELLGE